MEDVRIGRRTVARSGKYFQAASDNNKKRIAIPRDLKRVALVICGGLGSPVTLSLNEHTVQFEGIVIYPQRDPFTLDIARHGVLVTAGYYLHVHSGSEQITFQEVTLVEE